MSDIVDRKLKELRERQAQSPDGVIRTADLEEKINGACRTALNSPAGQTVMDYLRSITLNTVLPPSASDAELRMQEGMRRLFGILDARRNSKPPAKES
jgi:hypothetical protein